MVMRVTRFETQAPVEGLPPPNPCPAAPVAHELWERFGESANPDVYESGTVRTACRPDETNSARMRRTEPVGYTSRTLEALANTYSAGK